jgi:hypothetical protein
MSEKGELQRQGKNTASVFKRVSRWRLITGLGCTAGFCTGHEKPSPFSGLARVLIAYGYIS